MFFSKEVLPSVGGDVVVQGGAASMQTGGQIQVSSGISASSSSGQVIIQSSNLDLIFLYRLVLPQAHHLAHLMAEVYMLIQELEALLLVDALSWQQQMQEKKEPAVMFFCSRVLLVVGQVDLSCWTQVVLRVDQGVTLPSTSEKGMIMLLVI